MKIVRTFKHWGGKTKVLPKLLPLFPPIISNQTYVEPFCGSGVVGLNLNPQGNVMLGDLDETPVRKLRAMQALGYGEFARRVKVHGDYIWRDAKGKASSADPAVIADAQERWKEWYANPPTDELELQPWIVYGSMASLLGKFAQRGDVDGWRGTLNTNEVRRQMSITNPAQVNAYLQRANIAVRSYQETLALIPEPANAYIYCDPPYVGTNTSGYKHGAWTLSMWRDMLLALKPFKDAGATVVVSHISAPETDAALLDIFPTAIMNRIPRSNYAKGHAKRASGETLLELVAIL